MYLIIPVEIDQFMLYKISIGTFACVDGSIEIYYGYSTVYLPKEFYNLIHLISFRITVCESIEPSIINFRNLKSIYIHKLNIFRAKVDILYKLNSYDIRMANGINYGQWNKLWPME